MGLVRELEKIIELEKYKKGFLSYLSRYLHISFGLEYKYAQKFATKSFGSWFLDGIKIGKVVNFLPVEDIVRIKDLKYLAHRIGKSYGSAPSCDVADKETISEYKPFVFVFRLKRYRTRYSRYSPRITTSISPDEKNVTLRIDKYTSTTGSRGNWDYVNKDITGRSLTIRMFQYERLKKLYRGPPGFMDDNIFILLMKYNFVGTRNNHLSVPPTLLHPETTELFGSPLNTISKNYCSALQIDRTFGSKGSFFDVDITPGIYLANPPFVEDIMIDMVRKLLSALDTVKGLVIFVIIPVWSEGAGERGVTYVPWDLIKDSEYLRDHKLLKQEDYPFYDYYRDIYIPVADTHLILLSNIVNPDVEEYLRGMVKKWSQFRELIK